MSGSSSVHSGTAASEEWGMPSVGEIGAAGEAVETNEVERAQHQERQRKHIATSDNDEEESGNKWSVSTLPITSYGGDGDAAGGSGRRQALEAKMERLLKKPKARHSRQDEEDLEQYLDEKILRLKDEMNMAAQKDIETLNRRLETGDNRLIAMEKVTLLPKVISVLNKANLADTILDNNLLQSVRIWLEPLPDGSLPSFEIQKSLFAAIENLPIKTEHLKESGLGKVVIFYTKSKRVEHKLARLADRLVAEWTRPIIGASDNYRDKRVLKMDFDVEKHRKKAALDSAKSKKRRKAAVDEEKHKSLYELAAAKRNRAAAPAQTTTDYKYAPVSNISNVQTGIRTAGVGSTLNNNDLYKRLNSRLAKSKRSK
ncbi:AAR107Wp [Eremothecium gossypii ATCC 10895]|uniref:Transcription factor IWS1 n=1 Tax=Eremothecium gossypii (strain ATCC 10895 / CBS 109.51 / FGSC 9923 / NRRL Y-1056) TaxID=284811 RepID=IWS1_EREGS|nr:AAR107Wp [Eremothecium gossypii ATCC 10895]Q75EH2.1 RecName: Full=Transcription factor IWS1 [Eremothecium gossypii ATCC 10895]AAS50472.1 AAR107Wp [Eremothecium gossypii ATCC 10895]AEY94758.1 FAAR107Wp [Eremothecium gossypii FDAG1]